MNKQMVVLMYVLIEILPLIPCITSYHCVCHHIYIMWYLIQMYQYLPRRPQGILVQTLRQFWTSFINIIFIKGKKRRPLDCKRAELIAMKRRQEKLALDCKETNCHENTARKFSVQIGYRRVDKLTDSNFRPKTRIKELMLWMKLNGIEKGID